MNLVLISVLLTLCDLTRNPRSKRDPEYIGSLSANIAAVGQKVPAIGYFKDGKFIVLDGGCRAEALKLAGKPELLAIDLGKEPSDVELLMAQASVDAHKAHLPHMDRARLYDSLVKTSKIARESAAALGISESVFSRTRDLLKLCPQLQDRVNDGSLDYSKAIIIARETDPAKQLELAAQAQTMTGEQLRQKTNKPRTTPSVRQSRCKLTLPSATVTVAGGEMDLEQLISTLQVALEAARKANRDQLDIRTFERALKCKKVKS